MDITVKNLQKQVRLNPALIATLAKKILRHEGVTKAELSFVFVTDSKIRALNKKFLKRNYPTDVLAFDLREIKAAANATKTKILDGEIVISTPMAVKNSKLYRTTPHQEIILYVIHGILHLLGFNDHVPTDVERMRRKERQLLKFLGYDS